MIYHVVMHHKTIQHHSWIGSERLCFLMNEEFSTASSSEIYLEIKTLLSLNKHEDDAYSIELRLVGQVGLYFKK